MRDVLSVITSAFLTLAAWTATVNPSQADTGAVRIVFGAAGVVAGVGNGQGTLTLHGKTYPFEVSGASFGATLALTVSEYEGRALNLRTDRQVYCGRSRWCHTGRNGRRAVAKRE